MKDTKLTAANTSRSEQKGGVEGEGGRGGVAEPKYRPIKEEGLLRLTESPLNGSASLESDIYEGGGGDPLKRR